jgi:hypothetical protein
VGALVILRSNPMRIFAGFDFDYFEGSAFTMMKKVQRDIWLQMDGLFERLTVHIQANFADGINTGNAACKYAIYLFGI